MREVDRAGERDEPTMNLEAYRCLFDSLAPRIWMNHAGVSPISTAVAQAMAEHNRDVLEHGAGHTADWYKNLGETKRLAAPLVGCDPRDLAVTPNTTHGINLVANGIRWRPGDEVVLSSKEYPANVYPWWAQQAKGVRLVWVEPDEDDRLPVEAYAARMTERTRVVTVSHVQFSSGYRQDLERLGRLCREAGAIFVVDAIQSVGVFEVDCTKWGVDALTTGSHKWLLGPTGVALFFTTPKLRDEMETTYVGADCMVGALDYLDYRFEPLPDGRRFENAMPNFAGIAGLKAALEIVHGVGRETILRRIRENSDRLASALTGLGWRLRCSRNEDDWSGILSVDHPRVSPEEAAGYLKREEIVTSVRDRRLRVSPHAYHRGEDLRSVEEAMARAVG